MTAALHFSWSYKVSVPRSVLLAGVASLGAYIFFRSISRPLGTNQVIIIPSPRETALPNLSPEEIQNLPYPPDPLPGRRDIDSPLGSTRVYEWGPEDGHRVLLIHGISTPSIALADLAHKLVAKGYRVMLFDLFGRGYSSTPSPHTHPQTSALTTLQIHFLLTSSPLPWPSFALVGYSLGGALAADFASYFPHLVSSLVLVAPGGLIRREHVGWRSRVVYGNAGWVPEGVVRWWVGRRLRSGSVEAEGDGSAVALGETEDGEGGKGKGLSSAAVYTTTRHSLLPSHPNSTASKVVDWQIAHHAGFLPSFISAIRHAPIHEQHHRWRVLRQHIEASVGKLREVWMVLGESDPIVVAEELVEDARGVLGEACLRVRVVRGVGHEVAIERAGDVAAVVEEAVGRV